jgi:hypothetical protein
LRRIVEQAFLTLELTFHAWRSPEISWGRDLDCMALSVSASIATLAVCGLALS